MNEFRKESDSMGDMEIPVSALYGASTQRAVQNFKISNEKINHELIKAYALIKWASAEVNSRFDIISSNKARYIKRAAQEIIDGHHYDHFPVDVYQTGSGTSTNMNVNEVISNRCTQLLKDDNINSIIIHPNDDVNQSQSSNDTFPTAMHISAVLAVKRFLLPELEGLKSDLELKSNLFKGIIKIGRTHLMDATPITLGSEFSGFARQIELSITRISNALESLYELALGGTAVGTGLNCHKDFAKEVIEIISAKTDTKFKEAKNHFEAQSAKDALVELHGQVNTTNVSINKIANDIRMLAAGPMCNLGEIKLPSIQPGSSIMPGKVNPVISEALTMVAARVFGNQTTITWCGANGHLQLNAYMPLMIKCTLESINLTANGISTFRQKCLKGIQANEDRCNSFVEKSLAMATSLAPIIGYDFASKIAKLSLAKKQSVYDVCINMLGEINIEFPDLDENKLKEVLDPKNMI